MVIPNKWKAVQEGDSWQVQTENGMVVASIRNDKDAAVNTGLMAASPYLLEALKAIVDLIGDEDLPDNGELSGAAVCDMARLAITLV